MDEAQRSPYIVVEGGDGSGKDTTADFLVEKMQERGLNPLRVHEPFEHHPHGKLLRDLLRTGAFPASHAALFLADRMALQEAIVAPALEANRPVVSVRSFLSTLVYQQENWPIDWLADLHRMMPAKPDVIIYLDVSAEVGLSRVNKRGNDLEFYERKDIQLRNRDRYLSLMAGQDHEYLVALSSPQATFRVINADRTPGEIQDEVWATFHERLVSR